MERGRLSLRRPAGAAARPRFRSLEARGARRPSVTGSGAGRGAVAAITARSRRVRGGPEALPAPSEARDHARGGERRPGP